MRIGFSLWVRALGGFDWWKNQRSKISWHCPYKHGWAVLLQKCNGYIVLVTCPQKNYNGSIVSVSCPPKKLKRLHNSRYMPPKKIETRSTVFNTYSHKKLKRLLCSRYLPLPPKKIETVTAFRYLSSQKIKQLHSSYYLTFQKLETVTSFWLLQI
jgi:hypothetical protein